MFPVRIELEYYCSGYSSTYNTVILITLFIIATFNFGARPSDFRVGDIPSKEQH